jgi:transcriptional regulator with XRE-family HTH domain
VSRRQTGRSSHRARHRAYAAVLARALARRGETSRSLAQAAGVSEAAISQYLQGKFLPNVPIAMKMADYLMDNLILDMLVRLRTVTCQICGKDAYQSRGTIRKFCSRDCQLLAHKGLTRRYVEDERDAAIAAMCRACEPEGVCQTADCPLRGFSPLPYEAGRAA